MKTKITSKKQPSRLKRWTKETLKFVVIITLFSIAIDAWRGRDMPSETLPELAINTIDGDWVDIKKMSFEEPVVIYFWATWCSVCTLVSPTINWFSDNHQVVSVAITSGDDKRVQQFMRYKEYNFPVVNDPKGNISRNWGVTATPSIIIVKDGEISSITTGVTTPMGLWLRLYFA